MKEEKSTQEISQASNSISETEAILSECSFAGSLKEKVKYYTGYSTDAVIQAELEKLSKDEETLEVKDDHNEFEGVEGEPKRVYKGGNVKYEFGIPKVKGPIVKCLTSREKVDMEPPDSPIVDLDSEKAQSIASNYGTSNYHHSISSYERSDFTRQAGDQSLQGLIPDVNVKMFCSAEDIARTRAICKEREEEMARQMNVVALYSVKDAKPFYYISSAEARMAIDYINLCRQFKTDVVQANMDNINTLVKEVCPMIDRFKTEEFLTTPSLSIWQYGMVFENQNGDAMHWSVENRLGLISISRQAAVPQNIDGNVVSFQKFSVLMRLRTIEVAKQIINFHTDLNLLKNYFHYVICGKETFKLLMNDRSPKQYLNTTERIIFKMKAKHKSPYGTLPVFTNDKIDDHSILIVSKMIDGKNIVLSEYYMDKEPYKAFKDTAEIVQELEKKEVEKSS